MSIKRALSVFGALNDHVLTHRIFKRALVVIGLVRFNSREPRYTPQAAHSGNLVPCRL